MWQSVHVCGFTAFIRINRKIFEKWGKCLNNQFTAKPNQMAIKIHENMPDLSSFQNNTSL